MNIIPFPSRRGTPQHWVDKNPEAFFVAEDDSHLRRCSLCNKVIPPRQRYFGMYEIRFRRGVLTDWYIADRVAMRLHPDCAKEIEK
jgi:hypothetical protein